MEFYNVIHFNEYTKNFENIFFEWIKENMSKQPTDLKTIPSVDYMLSHYGSETSKEKYKELAWQLSHVDILRDIKKYFEIEADLNDILLSNLFRMLRNQKTGHIFRHDSSVGYFLQIKSYTDANNQLHIAEEYTIGLEKPSHFFIVFKGEESFYKHHFPLHELFDKHSHNVFKNPILD